MLGKFENVYCLAGEKLLEHQLAVRIEINIKPAKVRQIGDMAIEAATAVYHIRRESDAVIRGSHIHTGLLAQIAHNRAGGLALVRFVGKRP
jgi:acyl CoA:acetate/3-ketoacid CoA transferase beta subunit